MLYLYFIRLAS